MDGGLFMKADQRLLDALERLKKGEQEGFEVLYSQTYNFVYARARHIMCNEQEALDLVQEVYLAAYRNIGSLKNSICLYSWLGSIVVRQGAKMAKKNSRMHLVSEEHIFEEIEDTSVKIEETAIIQQNAEQLRKMIEKLPEAQKAVIIEYYYDGLKVEQIAELAECSKGTVTTRLYLARKHLREMIQEMEQKKGCTLRGFNTPMMIWAVGILLEETRMEKKLARSVYQAVCQGLNITPGIISIGSAGKSLSMERLVGEAVQRKSRVRIRNTAEYLIEIGKVKAAIIAAGTIAAASLAVVVVYRQMEIPSGQQQCGAVGIVSEEQPASYSEELTGHYEKLEKLYKEQVTKEAAEPEPEQLENETKKIEDPEISDVISQTPEQPITSEMPAEPEQPEAAAEPELPEPEQPAESEQPVSQQYASDSWTQAEMDALNTIVADWAWGLIDETETKSQLAAQLPGKICTAVHYGAGQYAEMQALVNSLDQSIYVLSSLLGDNETGSWFIYGK